LSDTSHFQTQSIEFALVEKDVIFGLQQGNAVLREINKEMSFELVEKLMDDTTDAIAYEKVSQRLCSWLMVGSVKPVGDKGYQ
jgi:charged multivesicular body protein 6